jgi:hypothetical protein
LVWRVCVFVCLWLSPGGEFVVCGLGGGERGGGCVLMFVRVCVQAMVEAMDEGTMAALLTGNAQQARGGRPFL